MTERNLDHDRAVCAAAQCKEPYVPTKGLRMHYHQCHRRAVKDGYCKQHHPDSIARRRTESAERWEQQQANSLERRLYAALNLLKQIEELCDGAQRCEDAKELWLVIRDILKVAKGEQ